MLKLHPKAVLTASLLAGHGLRKGSLSLSGSAAALLVGYQALTKGVGRYGHLANDDPTFGITMIVFYALGTATTKYKANIKASLEDGHGSPADSAGKRTAWQVLCNSTPSLLASVLYRFLFTTERSPTVKNLCYRLLGSHDGIFREDKLAKALLFATLGHFATCLGDTLASELGILSRSKPVLVTTLRPCPPGTNGGISLFGTGMSVVGGSVVGLTVAGLQSRFGLIRDVSMLQFVTWGAVAGFAGSMIDSLLGATLQQTVYDADSGKVLLDNVADEKNKLVGLEASKREVVSGLKVLSNNQVNFVSSATVAMISGYLAYVVL
ncbi:hypothetical protein QFC20_004655 [Naganishia adeliensis]|uniref:Uncharacterized protein n=1 Tax=Naganishia adeliensis TaxID=92952 RepID=A0ACC2VXD4_9TREE|nr:hypothetical protein QFC20_004655 [Naganishia adeliensis]